MDDPVNKQALALPGPAAVLVATATFLRAFSWHIYQVFRTTASRHPTYESAAILSDSRFIHPKVFFVCLCALQLFMIAAAILPYGAEDNIATRLEQILNLFKWNFSLVGWSKTIANLAIGFGFIYLIKFFLKKLNGQCETGIDLLSVNLVSIVIISWTLRYILLSFYDYSWFSGVTFQYFMKFLNWFENFLFAIVGFRIYADSVRNPKALNIFVAVVFVVLSATIPKLLTNAINATSSTIQTILEKGYPDFEKPFNVESTLCYFDIDTGLNCKILVSWKKTSEVRLANTFARVRFLEAESVDVAENYWTSPKIFDKSFTYFKANEVSALTFVLPVNTWCKIISKNRRCEREIRIEPQLRIYPGDRFSLTVTTLIMDGGDAGYMACAKALSPPE